MKGYYINKRGGFNIKRKILNDIKSGKHVFGSPEAYVTDLIKIKEEEKNIAEQVKKGEFYIEDANLKSELASLRFRRLTLRSTGDYLLNLKNNCREEPWKNSIIFCNVSIRDGGFNKIIDNNILEDDKEIKLDIESEEITDSNFISNDVLSSLMSFSHSDEEDHKHYDFDYIYDFVIQTKFGTYFINSNNTHTNMELPLFIKDNMCSSPNAALFEISRRTKRFPFKYRLYDVIYNKSGCIILKNDEWDRSRSKVIHISHLKNSLEDISVKEMSVSERFKHIEILYSSYYHKIESNFTKEINNVLNKF